MLRPFSSPRPMPDVADVGYPSRKSANALPRELSRVGERAARVVGLLGPELEVEVVRAELQAVRAAIDGEVVVQLEMLVVARGEDRRVAHRVVQTAGRNLREADVARIGRDARAGRPGWRSCCRDSALSCPPSTVIQPKRTSFSSEFPNTCVWLATRFRVFVVNDRPNPGTSVSWSALVPNGWSSSASNVLKRAKSWSASVSRWSSRTLN